jgi:RecA/RadA recombinase
MAQKTTDTIGSVGTKKNNVISTLLKSLDNEHATIAINGTAYDNKEFVDTGNLLFNAQLSGSIYGSKESYFIKNKKKLDLQEAGLSTSVLTMFVGDESCGKSYVLYSLIGNFLNKYEEDGIVVLFESEGAANKIKLEKRGIDVSRVIFAPVETVEDFKIQITKFIKGYKQIPKEERPKVFMGLDSLGMLGSNHECELAEAGESKSDMSRAKEVNSTFRIITPKLAIYQIPLVVINHIYKTMSIYATTEIAGGKKSKLATANIVLFTKSELKDEFSEEKNNVSGIYVTTKMLKSRSTKEKTSVKFAIDFKKGISKYSGLFDYCYEKGLIVKSGTRYHWHSESEDTKKYKKEIILNPEDFFNDNILLEFNTWCNNNFLLGEGISVDQIVDDEEIIDESLIS